MLNIDGEQILAPEEDQFKDFLDRLCGPEGLDMQEQPIGPVSVKCNCDFTFTINILKKYFPEIDINETLDYYEDLGGHCDCGIVFYVPYD